MAKKITLEMLAAQLTRMDAHTTKMDARIEKGFESTDTKFAALADDIGDIKHEMREKATKHQIVALHGQVNAIETQLRGIKGDKLVTRVADLEEEVFGRTRA
jgi:hypothetical protein